MRATFAWILLAAGCTASPTLRGERTGTPMAANAPDASADTPDKALAPLTDVPASLARLDVTEGAVLPTNGWLRTEGSSVRAVFREKTPAHALLTFRYLGETETKAVLASGDTRVQIGIKLRAADSCNVVYAMLRLEPRPRLVVQVKHNETQHAHVECENRGYRTIAAEQMSTIVPIAIGDIHRLRAAMTGERLDVWFDDVPVWRGNVGAVPFDGPVGFRSDGGRFDIDLSMP